MACTFEQYRQSADYIKEKIGDFIPKVAMVLGSGLGFLGDVVETPTAIPYRDIPHFKASTAPGHKGRLVFGTLAGQKVAVMQGRMHHYEGYGYDEVSYAVRVLRLLGCDTLIVTNAAGCVRTDWQAGDLMLITDQIKLFSESPLWGSNLPEFGVRFPDVSHLYTPRLQDTARRAAAELSTPPLMAAAVVCFIKNLHGHFAEFSSKVYHISPPLATQTPWKDRGAGVPKAGCTSCIYFLYQQKNNTRYSGQGETDML